MNKELNHQKFNLMIENLINTMENLKSSEVESLDFNQLKEIEANALLLAKECNDLACEKMNIKESDETRSLTDIYLELCEKAVELSKHLGMNVVSGFLPYKMDKYKIGFTVNTPKGLCYIMQLYRENYYSDNRGFKVIDNKWTVEYNDGYFQPKEFYSLEETIDFIKCNHE
ncbi:hypothetical protein P8860_19145 [Bacillus spizizenii]|uniref:Uncharacterized protein n=1 Tax=Bacillus spizizenii TaxID=96241 RepID=A0A9Q4DUS6_BACSC|nr:hypothetical protein [Bacillus spizizenii]MEC0631407.1 hypothetical protein [Bacillus spizizenii]